MMMSWTGRLAAAISLVFLALAPARATDPPGFLWQTTSQVVMAGMPFSPPPQTVKMCAARQWTRPPPGGDASCVTSDYKVVGNKVTWKMQCTGERPMTGTGEITFEDPDNYSGAITASAEGMSMTINLSGKKIGTCDNPQ